MSFMSTDFEWNGQDNLSQGIMLVKLDGGNITQLLSSEKTFITEHVRFKKTSFYGTDLGTYKLSFQVMKIGNDQEPFDNFERMDLMQFFAPDNNFHCFTSADFPDIEFWVQFSKTQFISFRQNVGIFELECVSNAPYPYAPMMYVNYEASPSSQIIEISNNSNVDAYFTPNVFTFTLTGNATSFSLANNSNCGKILSFTGLDLNESISINSKQEIISSTGKQRISNFNFGYDALKLRYGINRLQISANAEVEFKMQFPIQI